MQAPGQLAADRGFRPDLEGLRGIAILLVLAFHAGLPFSGGGFVGVDIFFVLSGYLITGLLLREREQSGRVDLRRFYARRARRILPASLVFIVATLAISALVVAPLDLPGIAADAVASALSVGNIRFALEASDYFSQDGMPSPLLHYWSLGVEEQFYLVWPAILILASRGRRSRCVVSLTLGLLLLASFAAAFALTEISAPWAFYSLPSRAWQLALGGLLAVWEAWHARLPGWALGSVGMFGLAAMLAAAVVIDPATPYPGLAAVLPSVGAAAVVVGGSRGPARALLTLPPIRFLGRISFSLYLVHWPILVLPAANLAIGDGLPLEARVGLALGSVAVAAASYRWIEQPFQRGLRLTVTPTRTLAAAGAAIAIAALVSASVGIGVSQSLRWGAPTLVSAAATAAPTPSPAVVQPTPSPERHPAASLHTSTTPPAPTAPAPTPQPSAASPEPTPTEPLDLPAPEGPIPLPPDVRPALADVRDDKEALGRCLLDYPITRPRDCQFGTEGGQTTVALVGDSHAAQWFPALERIAADEGWRLVTFTKVSCRFVDVRQYARLLKRDYVECDEWRERVVASLVKLQPNLVIVAATRALESIEKADGDPTRQGLAMARLLVRIPGRIAILVDTPQSVHDVPACLSRHPDDTTECETSRQAAFGWRRLLLERVAATASQATIVDLSHQICPRDPCPAVVDGMIVYRDNHHLTATFAASLAGELRRALPEPSGSGPVNLGTPASS